MTERGALESVGFHKYGMERWEFFRCVTCGAEYPCINEWVWQAEGYYKEFFAVRCNGQTITACPYCAREEKTNA
jgi:hypothetical protein